MIIRLPITQSWHGLDLSKGIIGVDLTIIRRVWLNSRAASDVSIDAFGIPPAPV